MEELFQGLVPTDNVRRRGVEDIEGGDEHRVVGVLVINHAVYVVVPDVDHVLVEEFSSGRGAHGSCLLNVVRRDYVLG